MFDLTPPEPITIRGIIGAARLAALAALAWIVLFAAGFVFVRLLF